MDQVHVIRHKVHVEGRSIRAVARELGLSRNTVRKYVDQPEPVRQTSKARARPVWERAAEKIESLLADWVDRTTDKQRITGTRVHQALVGEGLEVGITTVREILRERRRREAEVYIPLVHAPGDAAQVDFFEVTVDVEGERRRAWMFVMRLMYSGRDFAWLYERCDQVSFLDGHVRAFEHFGAVPQRLVYDNLTPAVRKVLFPRRALSERFAALVRHYLFEPCFARPGEGHDKGGVEARGKGIRLQHLTPIPQGETLEAIAARLLERLDAQAKERRREGPTVEQRFVEECGAMLPLAATPFEARRTVMCSVSRSARVKVEGAVYSVPESWAGLRATASVGPGEVEIRCQGASTCHPRQGFGGRSIRYRHYLRELSRKPQALRQVAGPLLHELAEPYAAMWRLLVDRHGPADAARVFAGVLEAVCVHGESRVAEAIAEMIAAGRVGTLVLRADPRGACRIDVPEALRGYVVESARADAYDVLLGDEG